MKESYDFSQGECGKFYSPNAEFELPVYDVLSYLASGMPPADILTDFPYLTPQDILACLSYAADREQKTLTVAAA